MIAGSTRLKAGTAQKLVLNMISTDRDGPAGKDVREPHGRRRRDEREAAGARAARSSRSRPAPRPTEVDAALDAADGDAKVAIVSLLAGIGADAARARLVAADGVVRKALPAMRLGVEAAIVDGRLVPGDVESRTAVS